MADNTFESCEILAFALWMQHRIRRSAKAHTALVFLNLHTGHMGLLQHTHCVSAEERAAETGPHKRWSELRVRMNTDLAASTYALPKPRVAWFTP